MNDLRVELRCRNNVLWHAIFDTSGNVAAFCRVHKLLPGAVGQYLNLQRSPYMQSGKLSSLAERLCEMFGLTAYELWPPDLYSEQMTKRAVAEVSSAQFLPLAAARRLTLPAVQPDIVAAHESRLILDQVIETLSARHQQVIRARYGMSDGNEKTFKEIGDELGVTVERARQIHESALRKLRARPRSRVLEPSLDVDFSVSD